MFTATALNLSDILKQMKGHLCNLWSRFDPVP